MNAVIVTRHAELVEWLAVNMFPNEPQATVSFSADGEWTPDALAWYKLGLEDCECGCEPDRRIPVLSHVTDPAQIRGKVVYGVLPLALAAEALTVHEVSMPGLPADRRGKELTPTEMDEYGATLVSYRVARGEPQVMYAKADVEEFGRRMHDLGATLAGCGVHWDDEPIVACELSKFNPVS